MGSQDLFHKRKAKVAADLDRRKAKRAAYEKVLIICEGEKTEPNYFNELVDFYKLNTANVEIDGSCGSSPNKVFERAKELYDIEEKRGDSYDKVYCVFDRDTHTSYDDTVASIRKEQLKIKDTFFHITSVPCFEFWLILHFNFSTKPYIAAGNLSSGDQVVRDLKRFIPEYTKGIEGIFSLLHNQIELAKVNADRVNDQANANHTDNPSTFVNELVHYLQNLKS